MSSPVKIIKAQALNREAFKPFGDVIEVSDQAKNFAINDGFSQRYHDLAEIDVTSNNGKILVNIFRSTPLSLPIQINKMERHPLSSQTFMPLGEQAFLVVVAPPGELDENAIQVFLANSNQGVNYRAGTWHHFSLALNQASDFLVIDRGGEDKNCDEVVLQTALTIELSL